MNHREGLSVFIDRPQVPLDNNLAERVLRGPVIGRRLSFGSDSENGARFTALMYSVVGTLTLNGIDVLRWLQAWLAACAANGQRPPHDLSSWLPWSMSEERRRSFHGAAMTGAVECRYYGRDFTAEEMALLRALIAGPALLNRHALSKEFCRRIGWFKPDGGLKDMMARVTMLAMHRGRPDHPAGAPGAAQPARAGRPSDRTPKRRCSQRPRPSTRSARSTCAASCAPPARASCGTSSSPATTISATRPWSAPRCVTPFTTAMARRSPCSASPPRAWKLAPRDRFIGWTAQLREKNLPLVVDNPRFLILPWIHIPNLGSHILAIVRRRLPQDWTKRYNTTPVLIETFVETPRYTGAVYRTSGWIRVGTTQGRGRYDRQKQYDKPKKDVWLRPLRRDWKRTLNR